MARYEGRIGEDGAQPLGMDELLELFSRVSPSQAQSADNARACYLSSSEGWRDALKQLGGAFADCEAGLTVSKEE